jgi:hypothetical protein
MTMNIPMTLHEHIDLEAFEARLARRGFAARSWALGAELGCALSCSLLTLACAVARIGGVL